MNEQVSDLNVNRVKLLWKCREASRGRVAEVQGLAKVPEAEVVVIPGVREIHLRGCHLQVKRTQNESAYSDPYSAPPMASGAPTRSRGAKEAAKKRTMLPAIFLYIVASLSILNHLGGIVLSLMGESTNPFMPQGAGGVDQAQLAGAVIGGIVGVLCDILVIVGAYNMQQMKSYGFGAHRCHHCNSALLYLFDPWDAVWYLVAGVINSADVKPHFD